MSGQRPRWAASMLGGLALFAAAGCGASGGIHTAGIASGAAPGSVTPARPIARSDDPHAARVAICLQRTNGVAPTLEGSRALLREIARIVGDWSPSDAPLAFSRRALEVQIRSIADPARGRSFDLPSLLEVGVPPTPALAAPPRPATPDATVSPADRDRALQAGTQRVRAAGAGRAAATVLDNLGASLTPDGSDGTASDIAGCAVAARDWLAHDPTTDGPRILILVGNNHYARPQDINPNGWYSLGALHDIDDVAMVSMCASSSECVNARNGWQFFQDIFIGHDSQFIPRDPAAAASWLRNLLEVEQ